MIKKCREKIHKWLDKNWLIILSVMVVMCCAMLAISCYQGRMFYIVAYAVILVFYSIMFIFEIRRHVRSKLLDKLLSRELETTYFHGFNVARYVVSGAFRRFTFFQEDGFCYPLSSLMMIALKNEPTAKLCRGKVYKKGKFQTVHSWVELQISHIGWCVIDISWLFPGIAKKNCYFWSARMRRMKIVKEWECSHEDFWKLKFSDALYEATRSPETSFILKQLYGYGWPDKYDFQKEILTADDSLIGPSKGEYMIPWVGPQGKIVSTGVLRDFVKNPKRGRPKARTIRRAYSLMREYERFCAKQQATEGAQ